MQKANMKTLWIMVETQVLVLYMVVNVRQEHLVLGEKTMTKISFDIEDSELKQLEEHAKKNERTLAAQLRFIIKEFLE